MKLHNPQETNITTNQEASDFKYKNILLDGLKELEKYDGGELPTEFESMLSLEGMSGGYYRLLINNVIKKIEDARYLEIGSWKGSTACAAMFNNKCKIVCIDNWSQFGGPKDTFIQNTNAFVNKDVQFTFIESNFRSVDYSSIGKFNVYLFDGPHEMQDQLDGITIAQPALDDTFILIVDDWNWDLARHGTTQAVESLGLKVLESITVRTNTNNEHVEIPYGKASRWHNGYFIAVVSK